MFSPCRKAKAAMLNEGIQSILKLKKKGKSVTKAIIEEREKMVRNEIAAACSVAG